ncbi:MAG: spore coat protein CotJB [Blautia sp.]|jgi:hypothetical protein
MNTVHLAITSTPIQTWENLYDFEDALKIGTIFPGLNKPFYAADGQMTPAPDGAAAKTGPQEERERLQREIAKVSFALDDLVLYLDTHPTEEQAITLRQDLITKRKQLLGEFDRQFYPLTKDCIGLWTEGPMPWEGACI